MDLEHLFQDLPKYKKFLTASEWEAWEQFEADSAQLLQPNPHGVCWELPKLVSAAIKASKSLQLHRFRSTLS